MTEWHGSGVFGLTLIPDLYLLPGLWGSQFKKPQGLEIIKWTGIEVGSVRVAGDMGYERIHKEKKV